MPMLGVLEAAESMARTPTAPQSALVEMWRNNLRKSLTPAVATQPPVNDMAVISIVFSGEPPTVGTAGLVEITFPCRIVSCHMFAADTSLQPYEVTAGVDIRLGRLGFWVNGSTSIWTSTMPSITAATEADVSIADWIVDLEPGDLLAYRLNIFTGPLAAFLAVSLPIRRLGVTQTSTAVITDSQADEIITDDGTEVVLRS